MHAPYLKSNGLLAFEQGIKSKGYCQGGRFHKRVKPCNLMENLFYKNSIFYKQNMLQVI